MTRRQGYIAFCTIGFIVGMFLLGKFATWGIAKWDWWFWGAGIAGFFIIGLLIEAAEKRNRRRDQTDLEGP
jgi:MFS family permease